MPTGTYIEQTLTEGLYTLKVMIQFLANLAGTFKSYTRRNY